MKPIMENITSIWGGWYIPLPAGIHELEAFCYMIEGSTDCRAMITIFKFDEDYNKHLDVVLPRETVRKLFQMEDLFKAPNIIAVEYNNYQAWINVAEVYRMATQHSRKPKDLTHGEEVWIPKESFNLLYKEKTHGSNSEEVAPGPEEND